MSDTELAEQKEALETFPADKKLTAVVTSIAKQNVLVKVKSSGGFEVRAKVPLTHLSDHQHHASLLSQNLKPGDEIKDLMLLARYAIFFFFCVGYAHTCFFCLWVSHVVSFFYAFYVTKLRVSNFRIECNCHRQLCCYLRKQVLLMPSRDPWFLPTTMSCKWEKDTLVVYLRLRRIVCMCFFLFFVSDSSQARVLPWRS